MSTATAPPESVEGPPSTNSASRPRKRRSFPWNDVATTLAAFALAFLVGALLIVTYVPAFSLALPRLFMGYAH